MKTIIQQKLIEIEAAYSIEILYSCESGSRAWGFPSPDSDYDIRFIYARRMEDYLTIKPVKDHVSFPIDEVWDIYGWDISKVLRLITQSNTTPFEWLQSPIVYKGKGTFRDELWQLCPDYFCPRRNIHHYLGIARGAMETREDGEIKIKKLFYVLRSLLAAMWSAKCNAIAPMSIFTLMELLPDDLRKKVLSLIELKSAAEEGCLIEIDRDIKWWIDEAFDYCAEASRQLDRKLFDTREADKLFRKMIMR